MRRQRGSAWLGFGLLFVALGCRTATQPGTGGGGTATTSSTATTTTSSSTGPLTCTVAYSDLPLGDCDMLQQDCPPGETCSPDTQDGWVPRCFAGSGLKPEGASCQEGFSECMERLFCIGGRCTPACCPGTQQPCAGGRCMIEVNVGGGHYFSACSYAKQCQLLTLKACDGGAECHIEDYEQGLATCMQPSAAKVPELGTCSYINDCGDMQHCQAVAGEPNGGRCLYYCDLNLSTPASPGLGGCPSGESCSSTVGGRAIRLGIEGIGLCVPPAWK